MLDFEYDNETGIETAEHRGLTINVHRDDYTHTNPWKEWDGNPPLLALPMDNNVEVYGDDPRGYMAKLVSPGFVGDNMEWCTEFLGYGSDSKEMVSDHQDDYDSIADSIMDECTDIRALEALAERLGIAYLSGTSRGYSQSDWADLFIVLTDDWRKETGNTPDTVRDQDALQHAFDLWSAWAWGDIFYYTIEDEDGETVGVCGGFYGTDHEKSGLADHARGDVNSHVRDIRKQLGEQQGLHGIGK